MKTVFDELRALHKPYKIYDDCGHDHGDEPGDESPDATVVDVDGIGLTCNHVYSICTHCCTDDGQTEYCASGHDHGKDKPICETSAILDKYTKQTGFESGIIVHPNGVMEAGGFRWLAHSENKA